jgi:5'-3' exonuclease
MSESNINNNYLSGECKESRENPNYEDSESSSSDDEDALTYEPIPTIITNKLDKTKPVFLIDTSYWLYYRFFALRTWYIRMFPETQQDPNFNYEHNWLEDEIFMTKYKQLFISNIKKMCRKFRTKITNAVFCIDCPHWQIWRCENMDEYKGTRLESHKKKQFNSFNIFSYIKRVFLPSVEKEYGFKIICSARCEADDIIGHLSKYLETKGVEKIYILANDNDYLQVCNSNIVMIDGMGKILSRDDNNGEKYLIGKILMGDVSDNIKPCCLDTGYIGFKDDGCNASDISFTGEYKKVYKNMLKDILDIEMKYKHIKTLLDKIRKAEVVLDNDILRKITNYDKLKHNVTMMDFEMIPNDLKNNLNTIFERLI